MLSITGGSLQQPVSAPYSLTRWTIESAGGLHTWTGDEMPHGWRPQVIELAVESYQPAIIHAGQRLKRGDAVDVLSEAKRLVVNAALAEPARR